MKHFLKISLESIKWNIDLLMLTDLHLASHLLQQIHYLYEVAAAKINEAKKS